MLTIANKQEYTVARQYLRYLQREHIKVPEHLKQLKKAIRKWEHRPTSERTMIDSDGTSALVVYPLPEWLKSREEADEYFRSDEYMEAPRCAWDCTGAKFTVWYKIFRRAGRFWCYHYIGVDC